MDNEAPLVTDFQYPGMRAIEARNEARYAGGLRIESFQTTLLEHRDEPARR